MKKLQRSFDSVAENITTNFFISILLDFVFAGVEN